MRRWVLIFMLFPVLAMEAQISWDAVIAVAPASAGRNRPRVTTNRIGDPIVIWGNQGNVMIARWNEDAFTPPIRINPDSIRIAEANWMGPSCASHGDTLYVVFKQTPENDSSSHIWCMRSVDGGNTFDPPVRVEMTGQNLSRFPTVTTTPEGHPVIAFMKFNETFGEARWVVTRSEDFGASFSPDVLASRWSNPNAEVCDCCPGTIVSSDSSIVVLYRDNYNNVRDIWAGVSVDVGSSFIGGFNADQLQWVIQACPSSGPDGIIANGQLYSTFMSGASGTTRVYLSTTSLDSLEGAAGVPITGEIPGLTQQNYPRIAGAGNRMAIVWKQKVSGVTEIPIAYTQDSETWTIGAPVASGALDNPDIVISNDQIFVVWQNDLSRQVMFRAGQLSEISSLTQEQLMTPRVYPNPAHTAWHISDLGIPGRVHIEVFDAGGKPHLHLIADATGPITINNQHLPKGVYFLRIASAHTSSTIRVLRN